MTGSFVFFVTLFFQLLAFVFSVRLAVKFRYTIVWIGISFIFLLRIISSVLIFTHLPVSFGTVFLYVHRWILPMIMSGFFLLLLHWLYSVLKSKDIFQKKISLERDRSEKYFNIVEVIIVVYDTKGIIKKINRKGCELLGYNQTELIGKNWFDTFILPENRGWLKKLFKNIMEGKEPYNPLYDEDLRKGNGEIIHVEWRAVPLYGSDGIQTANLCSGIDVTVLRKKQRELEKSLQEKDALLRELHHRTKNNMQVISAMLNLRAEVENNLHISSVFLEMDSKIQSMARAHEKLYNSNDLSHINFKEYFQDLIDLLAESYNTGKRGIDFKLIIENTEVLLDIAVPCGLILNECVTNAIKYAFPHRQKGTIEIILQDRGEGTLALIIKDNGVGIKQDINIPNLDSLGMRSITALGEGQLQGTVEWKTHDGVTCTVIFSNNIYSERV